ncbi:MAG: hypothetical protein JNL04_00170 [Rhodospirillaceae bacterium]|nr:hypothetical protein [Rhodospirillaceae bacterium]
MSALGSALALAVALARLVLVWLAGRPARVAERDAGRIARQRDEAGRPAAAPRDLVQRMRDDRL